MIVKSLFDPRVQLHVNGECDAYIEFHEDSEPFAIYDMTATARLHNFIEDDGPTADPYDMEIEMGDGIIRRYLVKIEHMFIPYQRSAMPDLSLTAYGPLSGEMPVVSV